MKKLVLSFVLSGLITACGSSNSTKLSPIPNDKIDEKKHPTSVETQNSSTTMLENSLRPLVREAKLIHLSSESLLLQEKGSISSQIFNLSDENVGEITKKLGKGWDFKAYNQPYSSIFYALPEDVMTDDRGILTDNRITSPMFQFLGMEARKLPNEGIAHYSGISFGKAQTGVVELNVDFAQKLISGTITERRLVDTSHKLDNIVLNQGEINANYFDGSISSNEMIGHYQGRFYGPNAEEISGLITDNLNRPYELFTGKK